jgi:hypothetical protein
VCFCGCFRCFSFIIGALYPFFLLPRLVTYSLISPLFKTSFKDTQDISFFYRFAEAHLQLLWAYFTVLDSNVKSSGDLIQILFCKIYSRINLFLYNITPRGHSAADCIIKYLCVFETRREHWVPKTAGLYRTSQPTSRNKLFRAICSKTLEVLEWNYYSLWSFGY